MRRIRFSVLAFSLAFPALLHGQTAQPDVKSDPLFGPVSSARALEHPVGTMRQRAVSIDLRQLGGSWGALPHAQRLQLNLFDTAVFVADVQRVEHSPHGSVWFGAIADEPLSQVVLANVGGQIAGSITMPGHTFEVRPAGPGLHVVAEVDTRLRPRDHTLPVPPVPASAGNPMAVQAANDDPAFIDVLVFYTTEVRERSGGENAALAMVNAAVAEANAAYQNSGITQRLRLVGAREAAYRGAGDIEADIEALQGKSDGQLDEIHAIRDALGADLVSLIVETDPNYCGVAYLMEPAAGGGWSPDYGFSVVVRECIADYTFVHELGHNMGATHDWYVDQEAGTYTYSHGYVDLDGRFYTVMSYPDLCDDSRRQCSPVGYFSNPNLLLNSRPLGVAAGTNLSCREGNRGNPACDADNTRTLNGTAQAIANFRMSRVSGNTVAFPPRNETFSFRTALETTYATGLGRRPGPSYADVEGTVVWVSEYLMYRIHQCSHAQALEKVRTQIRGQGVPAVCGAPPTGTLAFPARNEVYATRLELETIYRDELRRQPTQTSVDPEGDVVWIQEYLRYRLNGCSHDQAVTRVMLQINGQGIQPVCR